MTNDNKELKNNEELCEEKQEVCELPSEEIGRVTAGGSDYSSSQWKEVLLHILTK